MKRLLIRISPSDPTANPILTSTQAVLAYAAAAGIQRAGCERLGLVGRAGRHEDRGGEQARNGDSDKLLVHGVSPLADKMGKVLVLQACHRNLLCDVEKLDSLCQTGRPRGKVKSGRAETLALAVAKTRQARGFRSQAPRKPTGRAELEIASVNV